MKTNSKKMIALILASTLALLSGCGEKGAKKGSYELANGKAIGEAKYAITKNPEDLSLFMVRD